ncbi:MAG TPA: DNA replication/repair protein RecF [Firmicutes bacterium]|nr:DNA replication/repair protein RecF [Candidatus Fermentithermobacillaceae bacterium]
MIISLLLLQNFRNYPYLQLELKPGVSLFLGKNAQGKTNLLEACYYMSTLTSPRAEKESDLAFWGASGFSLQGRLEDGPSTTTIRIDVSMTPSLRRRILLNDRPAKRQDLSLSFPCVYFCPDDLYMVKGSSALRRRFMDSLLSREDPVYAKDLSWYHDTVTRRNMALKKAPGDSSWEKTLETLEDLLVDTGSRVLSKRLRLLRSFTEYVKEAYEFISGGECHVSYNSSIGPIDEDLAGIRETFKKTLEKYKTEERLRGMTLVGPHRDDLAIVFRDKTFRYFGSQGQQRSVVLALKMAEARSFEEVFHTKPVLLLDDVLSELDDEKRSRVLSLCSFGYQILLTATDFPQDRGPGFHTFIVKDNNVTPL